MEFLSPDISPEIIEIVPFLCNIGVRPRYQTEIPRIMSTIPGKYGHLNGLVLATWLPLSKQR